MGNSTQRQHVHNIFDIDATMLLTPIHAASPLFADDAAMITYAEPLFRLIVSFRAACHQYV